MIKRVLRDYYERLLLFGMSSLTQFVVYRQNMNDRNRIPAVLNIFYRKKKTDVARKPSVMV